MVIPMQVFSLAGLGIILGSIIAQVIVKKHVH